MKQNECIAVIDFGGQYNQLIARRIRDLNVYSVVISHDTPIEQLKKMNLKGIIFTGGPNSVYLKNSPTISKDIFELNIPILGICYGCQLIAHLLNGKVSTAKVSEYGNTTLIPYQSKLLKGIKTKTNVFMSHTDYVSKLPTGFKLIAKTKDCPIAAFENIKKNIYTVQFHPEVQHTVKGQNIFKNFVFDICHCQGNWQMKSFINSQVKELRNKIGNKKVLLALSGGVDSSVCAVLLSKAIKRNLICVLVDHGLMRYNEINEIKNTFKKYKSLNLKIVDASKTFYSALKGISDPEQKRKIIGHQFIEVFAKEAKKLGEIDFLAQGTIYPDVIESGLGKSATIKSHHNVGGLPKNLKFSGLIEPLRNLFKDEVRKLGMELGLNKNEVYRQPFPGPGLGVRIIGEVTPEKVKIVQLADYILRDEIIKAKLKFNPNQYFIALSNMCSVGVMGDGRTYEYVAIIRAVSTDDFMTAKICELPYSLLSKITTRIINEVKGINRVLYDLTSKPPGTIELE